MTVALVVVALLAALAGGAALASTRRARRLDRELTGVRTELSDARATIARRDEALADAERLVTEAEGRADHAESTVEAMEAERRTLDARATEVVAERDRLATELDQVSVEREDAASQVASLREQVAELEERAGRFRDEHRQGLDAAALWNLELARAERTWRHSVAVSPDQPSPFDGADDPLGVAVEVEVAALREEVGVAMELQWDVDVDDLARRLLVLRLVQELLSLASRERQAVALHAHHGDEDAVVLHLGVPDDHEPMEAVQLDGVEHLVTVDTDDGVRITVH